LTEREWNQQRIERVIMAYSWYFRKYMIAKAGGDQEEIAYWNMRALDFQRGVQKADPLGRWPMRFAKADRELEAEIMGGKGNGRILGAVQGERIGGKNAGGGDRDSSPRSRRRRDGYAAESGYAKV
jgi:hypothetical protein